MVDHSRQQPPRTPSRQESREGDAEKRAGAERIAKALARAGVASRRDIERLIEEGRVALNGQILTTPAVLVAPDDILTVDGKVVEAAEPTRVWRYHKPTGLVTTHKDPHDRPTVFQNLPGELPRVISVGRLDLNSEGLLLLTNDGELARALEMPTSGWVRRYRARAYGHATQAKLDTLKKGVTIEGIAYGPIEAKLDKAKPAPGEGEKGAANVWVSVSLTEGKNREVRRVLEHIGLKVNRLIRLAYGPFALATLPPGAVEEVGPRVIRELLAGFIAPQNVPQGDRRPVAIMPAGPLRRTPTTLSAERRAASGEVKPARRGARQPRAAAQPAEAPKKEHKPGWAKAKRKANPHAPPKTKDHRDARARGPEAEARGPARPRAVQSDARPFAAGAHAPPRTNDHREPRGRGPDTEARGSAKPRADFGARPSGAGSHAPPVGKDNRDSRGRGPDTEARGPAKPRGASPDSRPSGFKPRPGKPYEQRTPGPRPEGKPGKYRPKDSGPRIIENDVTPWAPRTPTDASAKPRPHPQKKPGGAKFGPRPQRGPGGGSGGSGGPRGGRPPPRAR